MGKDAYSRTIYWSFWKITSKEFLKTTLDVWLGDCLKLLAEITVEVPSTPLAPYSTISQW